MDDVSAILSLTIPLAPLAGFVILLSARLFHRSPAFAVRMSLGIASVGLSASLILLFLSFSRPELASVPIDLGTLTEISVRDSGAPPFVLSLHFRLDLLALLFLLPQSVISVLVCGLSLLNNTPDDRQSSLQLRVFFLWSVTSLLILSDHLLITFLTAQLSGLALASLLLADREDALQTDASRNVLLLTRLGDVFLLFGAFAYWVNLGTFRISRGLIENGELQGVLQKKPGVATTIGISLACAVIIRSALLPAFGWLKFAAHQSRSRHAILHGVFLPAGLYLLLRMSPVFGDSASTKNVLLIVGLGTALLGGLVSLSQTHWKFSLGFLSVTGSGWCALGIGLGTDESLYGALQLLIVLSTVLPAIFLIVGNFRGDEDCDLLTPVGTAHRSSIESFLVLGACGLLASGCVGQQSVLADLRSTGTTTLLPHQVLLPLLWLSLFLFALAAFRLFFRIFHSEPDGETPPVVEPATTSTMLVIAPGILILLGVSLGFLVFKNIDVSQIDLFEWLFPLSAGLAGAMTATGFLLPNPQRGNAAARRFAPLLRVGQHRFYFDLLFTLVLIFPVRVVATLLRFLDWFFIDTLLIGLPGRLPKLLGKIDRSMPRGEVKFHVLSLMVSITVLLALLTWFRG